MFFKTTQLYFKFQSRSSSSLQSAVIQKHGIRVEYKHLHKSVEIARKRGMNDILIYLLVTIQVSTDHTPMLDKENINLQTMLSQY